MSVEVAQNLASRLLVCCAGLRCVPAGTRLVKVPCARCNPIEKEWNALAEHGGASAKNQKTKV